MIKTALQCTNQYIFKRVSLTTDSLAHVFTFQADGIPKGSIVSPGYR